MPRRRYPVVAHGKTLPQINGLVAEQLSRALAEEQRTGDFDMPTHIFVKDRHAANGGHWRAGAIVAQAFVTWECIMRHVFNALELRHTKLRGAVQKVTRPHNGHWFECDLRLRYRSLLVLTSLKTGSDLRRAENRHLPGSDELERYHEAAGGGTWQGPHPQHGKGSDAGYVGRLSVSPSAWRMTIYRRGSLVAWACWEGQVRESGATRRAIAKAKAKAAPKAKAKAAPAPPGPAPGLAPWFPPAAALYRAPGSVSSCTSSAFSV